MLYIQLSCCYQENDQCLIHHNIQGLQDHTNRLRHAACKKYGMSISIAKTETMMISWSPKSISITINNSPLQQIKEFQYLDSVVADHDGQLDSKVVTCCQKTNNITYLLGPILSHPSIPMNAKNFGSRVMIWRLRRWIVFLPRKPSSAQSSHHHSTTSHAGKHGSGPRKWRGW